MARKKINAAVRALSAAGYGDDQFALTQLLTALRHWADDRAIIYAGSEAPGFRHYQNDLNSASGVCNSSHGPTYNGWHRIHDDNKAEGRPTGGQWSDEGVSYVKGIKEYRRYGSGTTSTPA